MLKSKSLLQKYYSNELNPFNLNIDNSDIIKIELPNIIQRFVSGLKNTFKYESNAIIESKISTKFLKLIPTIRRSFLMLKFNFFQKKYFKALSNNDGKPQKFIFFPLQMTPESSINTLESYFVDQLKLIDLIRLNMPHNFFLLVKEHPVMIGERKSNFYNEINKKSGVLLVKNNLSTKKLIKMASLIITITGTVGLEAYLDDRKTLMFGPTFSPICVTGIDHMKILKLKFSMLFITKKKRKQKLLKLQKSSIFHMILHLTIHYFLIVF